MKRITSTLALTAVAVSAGVGFVAAAGDAAAKGTPTPWINSAGNSTDTNAVGGLAFFDAGGKEITSGSTNAAPFAAYVAGLTTPRSGDTKASVFLYTPESTPPGQWGKNTAVSSAAAAYPNAAAPDPVGSTALPVYTGAGTDLSLESAASNNPQTSTTTGYVNTYELRVYTSRVGRGPSATYDFADITINSAAHTWSLVYTPDAPAGKATTSALSADKSTATTGDTVTLTDTVAPADTTDSTPVRGTVQFKDNGANVGQPVAVGGGKATAAVTTDTAGVHSYTAEYTPAALSGYGASTSSSVAVTFTDPPVTNTSVALAINPSTATEYTAVDLTATVSPSGAAGTVKFFDGNAQLGSDIAVTSGQATLTWAKFAAGTHQLTASFVPTNTKKYSTAVSAAVTFTATADTSQTIDRQPVDVDVAAGSLAITTPYTTANPLHVGTMKLNSDGTMLSAQADFGDKTFATYRKDANGKPILDGTGSIQVVDTRAGDGNWTALAQSSDLANGSDQINAQNVGLTGLTAIPVQGNALTAADLVTKSNTAASPALAPGAVGTAGLGDQAHEIAHTINGGNGSIGMWGTVTINAPTSTKAGHYTGIITFTVMGSTTI